MDFYLEPSGSPLEPVTEESISDSKLRTNFNKTEHQHKCLVSHFTFSDKLEALYSDIKSGEARVGSDGYYMPGVEMSSAA